MVLAIGFALWTGPAAGLGLIRITPVMTPRPVGGVATPGSRGDVSTACGVAAVYDFY